MPIDLSINLGHLCTCPFMIAAGVKGQRSELISSLDIVVKLILSCAIYLPGMRIVGLQLD